MPKLVMTRVGDRDIQHRYAVMSLDGEFLCRMRFKETHTHEIEPGKHILTGKNEIGKRTDLEFEASEDATVYIHVEAVPSGCFAILMWIFPPAPEIKMTVCDGPVEV